jgi:L,D-transpeptidase YcbB
LHCHIQGVSFSSDTGIIMKKLSLVTACVALTVFSTVAWAEQQRPRRIGFFEKLFGGFERPPRRVERQRAWWEDDPSDVRVIRSKDRKPKIERRKAKKKIAEQKKAPRPVAIDPEVGEGLGMGNRDYIPVKLTPVFDPSFAKLESATTAASALRLVLADRASNIRSPEAVRKSVLEFYKGNGFKPLWTENGNINARGLAVLDVLSKAADEGLEPLRYKPAVLENFTGAVAQLDGDGLGLAQFDLGLTVAAITYAMHQSGGAYEPERLSAYHDVKPERVSPETALRVLAYSPYPAAYLQGLAPSHPAYRALKEELAALSADKPANAEPFPDGKRVRIGQKDVRVLLLRERLSKAGFLSAVENDVADDKVIVLDKTLAKALKRFQAAKGIAETSNLDQATVKALNGPDVTEQRNKLISSMERVRWLPKDLGQRHVMVNQASYRVNVLDQGKLVWASNVIVGKPLTQTSVFSDTFESVVFNPTWGVPQSIILNEYLPKLRANPGYLDKIGFKTLTPAGKVVSSRSINWNSVGANSGIGVMQPSGGSNALGEVKFLFPNSHSIYMHDTPNRELFAQNRRNFSHGCVRVENPREFAEILLNMAREEVDANIESGKIKNVKVTTKTSVHLAYFTAWPDESGKIQYHSDAYGRDVTLKNARDLMFKLAGGSQDVKVVQNAN